MSPLAFHRVNTNMEKDVALTEDKMDFLKGRNH